jgi:hypothetical protein
MKTGPPDELTFGEDPGKQSVSFFDVLGNHSDISKDRHKIAVSSPAGNDVHMDVVCDTGTGSLADIPADVETLSGTDFAQSSLAADHQLMDFHDFIGLKFGGIR